ncbi:hypothetical protein CJ178_01775 [Rhodococcus sp. ACPA4]|uniref:hypothetical protein n=1 Tax=Rhodococcus sp. ACPA4 TaxID=2028571 RepID=UPI000BB14FDF|nr:hypothetical protein [Rhodococcus sp. ACPA4]PBC40502.1 hypothetical protein CJ178_01775 [Rhodococcus sp. ACPA4]
MSSYDQPNKNRRRLVVFLLVIVAFIAVASFTQKGDQPTGLVVPTETATSAPAQQKSWHRVIELSGSTSKRSDIFQLNSSKQRITYTVNGEYSPFVNVYVMAEGKSLDKNGGIPEVTMAPVGGDTLMYKASGGYYLDVSGNGEWSVVVEEWK